LLLKEFLNETIKQIHVFANKEIYTAVVKPYIMKLQVLLSCQTCKGGREEENTFT